ncbi:hypothetical protein VNO78_33341 [Psophocarpus tetragonolobus]|uniref:CWF19-like protein 2 n=1 Tax=Psophocarpus tetragonolobus TaxID=3891 RepID=A0AAN9RQN1_PSOTE
MSRLCYSLETWKMLSGVKFIPRDQVHDEDLDSILKEKKKLDMKREKNKRKGKSSGDSSDDDDELDKIKKRSRKKWYSSDEDSSIYTTESESEKDEKKRRKRVKKKTHDGLSPDSGERSKARSQSRSCKKEYTSEDEDDTSYSSDGSDSFLGRQGKRQMSHRKYGNKRNRIKGETTSGTVDSTSEMEIARKEMGLDWMLRSESKRPAVTETEEKLSEVPVDESKKVNDKELNPYLKDNRCGYPEESDGAKVGNHQFLSSFLVGDGGASWRLKALKRAQEQAAREGQDFLEVLEERWGSLGELTASVASHAAAPARAHLCAVKNRQRGRTKENSSDFDKHGRRDSERDYLKDVSLRQH